MLECRQSSLLILIKEVYLFCRPKLKYHLEMCKNDCLTNCKFSSAIKGIQSICANKTASEIANLSEPCANNH